jgi:hypothetical protein
MGDAGAGGDQGRSLVEELRAVAGGDEGRAEAETRSIEDGGDLPDDAGIACGLEGVDHVGFSEAEFGGEGEVRAFDEGDVGLEAGDDGGGPWVEPGGG